MTEPLAILFYEKLIPGSQLTSRLQDLRYRVRIVNDAEMLPQCAEESQAMIVVADLASQPSQICSAITRLRQNANTAHIPVIGFAPDDRPELQETGREAGATLAVTDAAVTHYLPQLLEQALAQF